VPVSSFSSQSPVSRRLLGGFLWLAVVFWGVGLGAKIFDLVVVAGAWSAAPPASFSLLPYGKSYPVNPGTFFQPLSAGILLASLGALVCGWKSPLRRVLVMAVASFVVIWILTPTVFWPIINELWGVHRGRIEMSHAEVISLVRRWYVWDSLRVAAIAAGFVSSVQALIGQASIGQALIGSAALEREPV